MALYAVEEIEEAFQETKDLLFPIDRGTWLRLFLIVFLTGSGMGAGNITDLARFANTGSNGISTSDYGPSGFQSSTFTPEIPATGLATASPGLSGAAIAGIAVLAVVLLLLILIKLLLQPFFEFVYYQSLLDKQVNVRDNFSQHFDRGASYLLFLVATALIKFVPIAIGAYLLFLGSTLAGGAVIVIWLLFLLFFNIFLGLTHNFILLRMMENETGIIESWKSFYPLARRQWKQVLGYVFIRFVLKITVGIAVFIASIIAIIVLLIPFGVLGYAAWVIGRWLLVAPVALLGIIALLVVVLAITTAVQTFYRYYSILVYNDLTA